MARVSRSRECDWPTADGERHTFVTTMSPDLHTEVVLIPTDHLRACLDAEGCPPSTSLRRRVTHDDPQLRSCMARLLTKPPEMAEASSGRADEAARRG